MALQPVTFANSREVFVGQSVMAIGSPFGSEQAFTLTTGIVAGWIAAFRTTSALQHAGTDPDRRGDQPRQQRRPAL